jgi:hypothetical protein
MQAKWSREERVILVAGALGVGVAAVFRACGGDDASTPSKAEDAGADDSASTSSSPTPNCERANGTAENAAAAVTAANAFLDALTADQKTVAQIARTQANAIQRSNFPAGVVKRNGVRVADMSDAAQGAAMSLAEVASGSTGTTLYSGIRAADDAFKGSSGDATLFGDGQE